MQKILQYEKVIQYIQKLINSGKYVSGDLIPSESQLIKILDVSVGTVRKAIGELVKKGTLYSHHGKGTYVSSYDFDNSIFNFFSYGGATGSAIRINKTTPVRQKIKANKEIAKQLQVKENTPLIYLEHIGYFNEKQPVLIEKCWWLANMVDGLQDENLHIPDLLYALIKKKFNINIVLSSETLTANIANEYIAKKLDITINVPVVILKKHTYTLNKKIVEFCITHGRSDMFSYTTTIGHHFE